MSAASMGEEDEGDPMMQSPRSNDGTSASGPNVAALGEALESPLEITHLKVPLSLDPGSLLYALMRHIHLTDTKAMQCDSCNRTRRITFALVRLSGRGR